jgi:hypothetical protein
MSTDAVIPGIIRFIGGIATGWVLCTFSSSRTRGSTSGGGAAKPKKKKKGLAVGQRAQTVVPRPKEELKMVLCVNTSLGMGKGKIGEGLLYGR